MRACSKYYTRDSAGNKRTTEKRGKRKVHGSHASWRNFWSHPTQLADLPAKNEKGLSSNITNLLARQGVDEKALNGIILPTLLLTLGQVSS